MLRLHVVGAKLGLTSQVPKFFLRLELTNHITLHANVLKLSSTHSSSSEMILLVVRSANGDGSALTSKASSKVSLVNDSTYQWDCTTVIVSSFGQIKQSAQ